MSDVSSGASQPLNDSSYESSLDTPHDQMAQAQRLSASENDHLSLLIRAIDWFQEFLGRLVAWFGFLMVCGILVVVVMRHGLNAGSIALQEIVQRSHAALFMLGASYALKHDAHVRVDVLSRNWSKTTRAWVEVFGTIILLVPMCLTIFWASLPFVISSWSTFEGSSETGGLPGIFLEKTLIPVTALLVLLAGLAKAGHAILIIRNKEL